MKPNRNQNRKLDLLDISKYTQDPHVNYDGSPDEDKLAKVIGTIKAVKIA